MMEQVSLKERKSLLNKLHLTAHPLSNKTRCLGCGNARLQIKSIEDYPDEYASPAVIAEFVRIIEINIICTATAQTQIKLAQITDCELFEVCHDN